MKILVVAAHPDDEVLGCGATMAKLSKDNEVATIIMGDGVTSRYKDPKCMEALNEVGKLREQCMKVGEYLGVINICFEEFPDNRFDTVPMLDLAKALEAEIDAWQPDIIYTHSGGDLNIDHRRTFQAVLTASRPYMGSPLKKLYSFEVPSATEWSFQSFHPVFKPNTFEDVNETMHMKLKAIEMYDGEARSFPHPRSPEILKAYMEKWGATSGMFYAEPFELIYDRHV